MHRSCAAALDHVTSSTSFQSPKTGTTRSPKRMPSRRLAKGDTNDGRTNENAYAPRASRARLRQGALEGAGRTDARISCADGPERFFCERRRCGDRPRGGPGRRGRNVRPARRSSRGKTGEKIRFMVSGTGVGDDSDGTSPPEGTGRGVAPAQGNGRRFSRARGRKVWVGMGFEAGFASSVSRSGVLLTLSSPPPATTVDRAMPLPDFLPAAALRPELALSSTPTPRCGALLVASTPTGPRCCSAEARAALARAARRPRTGAATSPRPPSISARPSLPTAAPTPTGDVAGVGSDEVILDRAHRAQPPAAGRGRAERRHGSAPTFVMYKLSARARLDARSSSPARRRLGSSTWRASRAPSFARPNVVFIASPNNPTGALMSETASRRSSLLARDALVIVDEAYIDLPRATSSPSPRHPNVAAGPPEDLTAPPWIGQFTCCRRFTSLELSLSLNAVRGFARQRRVELA